MKQPKKPSLPTKPTKPYGEPAKRILTCEYMHHNLNFSDTEKTVSSLIKELQALSVDKDPDKIIIKCETEYGYYDDVSFRTNVLEQKEIDNPNYEKQLASFQSKQRSFENKSKEYERRLKQYHIDMEQYHIDMEQYDHDLDMKAYYDWKVTQKKVAKK